MAYRKLYLVVLISICWSSANCSSRKRFSLPKPDEELKEAIEDATNKMWTEMSQDIANFGKKSLSPRGSYVEALAFDDTILEYKSYEIALTNIKSINQLEPEIVQATPNMEYNYLDVVIQWNNVIMETSYELNKKQSSKKTERITGKLRFGWKNVQSNGRISFNPLDKGGFKSTNYDLNLSTTDPEFLILGNNADSSNKIISEPSKINFQSFIQNNLKWNLQAFLRTNIDNLLKNQSIERIFGSNDAVLQKYRSFVLSTQSMTNELIDEMMLLAKEDIQSLGYWKIPLNDVYKDFTRKYGFIKVHGYLSMSEGSAQNFSTIYKASNFSLTNRDDSFEITGSLGFEKLSVTYDHYKAKIWNIGPSGSINADIGSNSVLMKLTLAHDDESVYGYKILGYDLQIFIDKIKVKATGLSFALNWLLSIIATSVANNSKEEVINKSEEYLRRVINDFVDKL